MRKNIFTLAALVAALLVAGCQAEIDPSAQPSLTFTASLDEETRTTMGVGDDEGKVFWVCGDKVSINGKVYSTTSDGTTTAAFLPVDGDAAANPSSPCYEAFYPATINDNGTLTLPYEQYYSTNPLANSPMFAMSNDTHLSFRNLCGLIRLTLKGSRKVSKIEVYTNDALSGVFTMVSDGEGGYKLKVDEDSYVGTVLHCEPAVQLTPEGVDFHISVPAGLYSPFSVTVTADDGQKASISDGIVIKRSKMLPITWTPTFQAPHVAEFSVSDTKKVRFSSGNLCYENGSYGFESSQLTKSANSASHTGLFSWTDGGFSIGGKSWRLLAKEEWEYLSQRDMWDSGYKKGVTIDGQSNFVVFAPDGNNMSIRASYTAQQWAEVEAAGFVCLSPTPGDEPGTWRFRYWSSSKPEYEEDAYCVVDDPFSLMSETQGRDNTLPIRLVCDVE